MNFFSKISLDPLILILIIGTSAADYNYKSAPGCPKEKVNQVWLKDEIGGNCFEVNSQGPCGENMLFYHHPFRTERVLGFCDCYDARKETQQEVQFLNDRNLTGCLKDLRSQIFVPERNRCYSAFNQGPCPDGKWLVLNETFYPVCVRNQCPSEKGSSLPDPSSTRFQFSHSANDKCYNTITRGYCQKSYKLRFSPNDWLPKCRYSPQNKNKCPPKVKEIFRLRCKPGSRRNYLSKCTQSINPRR